jgi:hypothetical protein
MERRASDKHTSLLQTSVNYGHRKFYDIGPWSFKAGLHYGDYHSKLVHFEAQKKYFLCLKNP